MAARKVCVLLVNHFRDMRDALELSLSFLGYEVAAHAAPEGALAALEAGLEADVALVDLTLLPEAAAAIVDALQASRGGSLPVVGMTTDGEPMAGVFHMIQKPFDLDVLDAVLVAAVKGEGSQSAS